MLVLESITVPAARPKFDNVYSKVSCWSEKYKTKVQGDDKSASSDRQRFPKEKNKTEMNKRIGKENERGGLQRMIDSAPISASNLHFQPPRRTSKMR